MRVLGVDPGLTRCGVGIVEGQPGTAPRLVAVTVLTTPADLPVAQRLLSLSDRLDDLIGRHHPDAVSVERVFSQVNVRTVMGTAQAGAVALTCAARAGLPVSTPTPSEVKAAVTGDGRADKAQVATVVARLLRLSERPRPADAADALALAICHLWRATATERLVSRTRGGGSTGAGSRGVSTQVSAPVATRVSGQEPAAVPTATAERPWSVTAIGGPR